MMKDLSTLHKKDLKKETSKKRRKSILKWQLFGSFLTVAMLICALQLLWGATINISKIISYKTRKIPKSIELRDIAIKNNMLLREEKNNFSSEKVEEIARNDLKMARPDEIFIQFIGDEETKKEPKNLWERILMFADKSFDLELENYDLKKNLSYSIYLLCGSSSMVEYLPSKQAVASSSLVFR